MPFLVGLEDEDDDDDDDDELDAELLFDPAAISASSHICANTWQIPSSTA